MSDIYLDTETTGLSYKLGDKLVSVAAIKEGKDNEVFYIEVDPQRDIPSQASRIHGIDKDYLKKRHARPFPHYAQDFLNFVQGNRLIIHNATFDVGFLNNELRQYFQDESFDLRNKCQIVDTLKIARGLYKGQGNSLDALAQRFNIASQRERHHAVGDSQLLQKVAKVLFSQVEKQGSDLKRPPENSDSRGRKKRKNTG